MLLDSQYRRIEVTGAERVPASGAVILVANHGNSLVDSLAILHASPRVAAPLAKAPLFKSPLLARFLRALDAVPVYRPQDVDENEGRGARANVETFRACHERLRAGGAIVLFPEGVSQPQPHLMPLRTGAARIALDVGAPVSIVPVGLAYEPPDERRGTLLVRFGEPFVVDGSTVGPARRGAIASTTRRIEAALRDLLAEAESQGDLAAMRVLRLVQEQEKGLPPAATLEEEHARTQPIARGFRDLEAVDPAETEAIRAETDAFRRALAVAGVPLELLDRPYRPGRVLAFVAKTGATLLVAAPVALAATVLTWPARVAGDVLAARASLATEDVWSLTRMVGRATALVVWTLLVAVAVGVSWRPWAGVAALLLLPALFVVHVLWRDWQRGVRDRVRAFLALAGGRLRRDLQARRRALHQRLEKAAARIAAAPARAPDPA
jgi:1-acyl-sn-glycerol-3-phosphate acyltransferase